MGGVEWVMVFMVGWGWVGHGMVGWVMMTWDSFNLRVI